MLCDSRRSFTMCLVVQHPPAITAERALTRYSLPFFEKMIVTELALPTSPSCSIWTTVDDRRILAEVPATSRAAKLTRLRQTPSTLDIPSIALGIRLFNI